MSSTRYLVSGILFVLISVMGFVTKGMGRPLNTAAFTAHKLLALAFIIYTVMNLIALLKKVPVSSIVWALIVFSGLVAITLFATGAMLSGETPAAKLIHILHDASPALLVVSLGLTYYLASGNIDRQF